MFESATAFETPAGACGLAWSAAGLTCVRPFEESLASAAARVANQGAVLVEETKAPPQIAAVIAALRAFLSGAPTAFDDVALDFSGLSDFEAALYGALQSVRWGETVSYGDLARRIGADTGAARAVGVAMGRNPWPLIVPCHRVLTSEGKLGGFSAPGGERTKADLLAREGVHLDGGQRALFD
ncbi:MAG: methylated-DNA--[protein]-cysteine S-methyltransferase [Hyphomonas sp.]